MKKYFCTPSCIYSTFINIITNKKLPHKTYGMSFLITSKLIKLVWSWLQITLENSWSDKG